MIKKILLLLVVLASKTVIGQAAGTLDTSFGTNGKLLFNYSSNYECHANGVAVQSDGKIIVVGYTSTAATQADYAVTRLHPDGTFDATFGVGGKINLNLLNTDIAEKVIIDNDGKIYVGGTSGGTSIYSGDNFTVVRLNSNGSIDTTYGNNGKAVVSFSGNYNFFNNMTLQSDGKLLVCGKNTVDTTGNYSDFAVARFNADGTLDFDFSNDGKLTLNIRNEDVATALMVEASGNIIVAGTGSSQACFARYFSDGTLDTSFGTAGKINVSIANLSTTIYDAKMQSDGKIVVTGYSFDNNNGGYNSLIARFEANGTLDTTYGTNGYTIKDIDTASEDQNIALLLQPDGKAITCGRVYTGGTYYFSVLRFTTTGVFDTTFSNDGILLTSFGTSWNFGMGLSLQPDGKLVVVGYYDDTVDDIAIARYHTGVSLANATFINRDLKVVPNPAKETLAITSSENFESNYTIYDVSGRTIKTGVALSNQKINISALQVGVYYLKLENTTKAIPFLKN